jgi:ATP synthase protein I
MALPDREDASASFEQRLSQARARHGMDAPPATAAGGSGMSGALGIGLRVGVELVSALAVGVGIGWALDHWLHTTPIFIAVFVLLGGAAGLANVWRLMGPKAQKPPGGPA